MRRTRKLTEFIREGKYAAKVPVEFTYRENWSLLPTLGNSKLSGSLCSAATLLKLQSMDAYSN
jgi:hypothetical protein